MDPEKIRSIMEWATPINVNEVISFMGLSGYYRRFIRNFSRISYPITSLKQKGKKLEWIEECASIFKKLKNLITNSPVLKIAYPEKEFVVCTNDCKIGIGGVLM